jgi:hypothetical protein
MSRGPLIGTWLGIGLAWGALAVLVLSLHVEPGGILIVVLGVLAVAAAVVVARRHGARGRRTLIRTSDLRKK